VPPYHRANASSVTFLKFRSAVRQGTGKECGKKKESGQTPKALGEELQGGLLLKD